MGHAGVPVHGVGKASHVTHDLGLIGNENGFVVQVMGLPFGKVDHFGLGKGLAFFLELHVELAHLQVHLDARVVEPPHGALFPDGFSQVIEPFRAFFFRRPTTTAVFLRAPPHFDP